jgi:beta propeller repeat protein
MKIGLGYSPATYGDKAVWNENENGTGTGTGTIRIYDMTSKASSIIADSGGSHPDIYGNKVVWHDESSGTSQIKMRDIQSHTESVISGGKAWPSSVPHINGNLVVWSAGSPDDYYAAPDVYVYDIGTHSITSPGKGDQPDIYGSKVVYVDATSGITVYDVISKEITSIPCSSPQSPHIYGDKIVYSDLSSNLGTVVMYDLTTKKFTPVTNEDGTGYSTSIMGGNIFYGKSIEGTGSIVYKYDIASGKTTELLKSDYTYPTVAVCKNILVGFDQWPGSNPIYRITDSSPAIIKKPTVAISASKTTGTVPLTVSFTSKTTGNPTSYRWTLAGKSYSSSSVKYTFTKPGKYTYTVCLTVKNAAGSATATKKIVVVAKPKYRK